MESINQHQFSSYREFKAIMDPMPVMVRACMESGEDCYLNAASRRFVAEVDSWTNGIHPDFLRDWKELFATHRDSKKAFKTKYRFRTCGGAYRWLAEHALPWYTIDKVFLGFVCYVHDIDEFVDASIDQITADALEREQTLNEELAASNEELNVSIEELQRAQHELNQANSNLEQIINMLPACVVVIRGQELIVELVNNSNLNYWNKTKEQVLGKPFLEILPDLAGQPFAGQLRKVMETGEIIDVKESPVLFTMEDGSVRETYVDYIYQPLSDLEGNRTGVLVMSFEITERVLSKRLLEQYAQELASANAQLLISNEELARREQHFRYLADMIPAKISNALPNGEVTFFNKQWLDFASMDFENMRDFGYHQMMHPEEIPAFQTGLAEAAVSGIPHVSEMRFKNTEGKYIWHLNIASPVLDEEGLITMWVGSTMDIQALKEEEQRKTDFVGMLSHELKTPVTSIKGHVQLALRSLDKEIASPLGIKLRPSLVRIDKLLLQLTGLIGDMLDLTRLEAGRLDLRKEAFFLDILVAEVVDDFRLSHEQYYFHLNTEKDIQVVADRHKISQVLINLISNAVKYAPTADVVDISLMSSANEILISVRDYGIGIEEKDQQKIFERFYRVEGHNESHYNGFGIGLFLVNSIIGYHGGKISLQSSKGKGSTFTAHLPR